MRKNPEKSLNYTGTRVCSEAELEIYPAVPHCNHLPLNGL